MFFVQEQGELRKSEKRAVFRGAAWRLISNTLTVALKSRTGLFNRAECMQQLA